MLRAFLLSLGQLTDRRILTVIGKSLVLTAVLVAVLGTAAWWALDTALGLIGLDGDPAAPAHHHRARIGMAGQLAEGADSMRGLIAGIVVVIGAWMLFRLVAIAVLQFFADDVVEAVEARHYPAQAAAAHPLGWRQELRVGARGFVRSALWNLAALPVAAVLLLTGLGPALLFVAINAVLVGRELADMVRLRHRDAATSDEPPLPSWAARFGLGLLVVVTLAVPLANFIAPVIGAAMATHLVHRRTGEK